MRPLVQFLRRRWPLVALFFFVCLAAVLRFYHLDQMGFRFCDEGARLMHPKLLNENQNYPSLYYKHGLMFWIFLGLKIFGFTCYGALSWSIVCGLASIFLVYALWARFSSEKTALLGAIVYGMNYYIFYYQRSNMSDGYALFFFILTLLLLVIAFQYIRILQTKSLMTPLLHLSHFFYSLSLAQWLDSRLP